MIYIKYNQYLHFKNISISFINLDLLVFLSYYYFLFEDFSLFLTNLTLLGDYLSSNYVFYFSKLVLASLINFQSS